MLVTTACTPGATSSDDEADGSVDEGQPVATVTIPPVRLTPFCQAMIDLADRLEQDPPDDIAAEIIEAYEEIAPEVPEAIRGDFDAVLADLRVDAPPTTTEPDTPTTPPAPPDPPNTDGGTLPPGDAFFDEGYDPDDDPALRLNAYVDFECRDVANNPGPPPTQPLSEPDTTQP